jgi:hypothetical protein
MKRAEYQGAGTGRRRQGTDHNLNQFSNVSMRKSLENLDFALKVVQEPCFEFIASDALNGDMVMCVL